MLIKLQSRSRKVQGSFVSVPQDVTDSEVKTAPIAPMPAPVLGPASPVESTLLAQRIKTAKLPVLLFRYESI